jgi:hypothetical protein
VTTLMRWLKTRFVREESYENALFVDHESA